MFKSNSFNHIIFSTSIGSAQHLPFAQNTKNAYMVVTDHSGHLYRKYEFELSEFNQSLYFFEWRKKTHHPIPKIIHIIPYADINQRKFVSIVCQHININFVEIRLLKIEEIMYCLSEMILGHQEIFARLGFTCVEAKMIGLNAQGQILFWISQNLLAYSSDGKKSFTQKQIVTKIIQLLETKTFDKNNIFFAKLRKLQPKFKVILDFIILFKNKNKLKIIPKILVNNHQSQSQKTINKTFSFKNDTQFKVENVFTNERTPLPMKLSYHAYSSYSSNQFISSGVRSVQRLKINSNYPSTRTSIIQSNTSVATNMENSFYEKSTPKIHFSYSQKRQQLSFPKQSIILREYTSDQNLSMLKKMYSETNTIKEFSLEEQRLMYGFQVAKRLRNNLNKKIVKTYSVMYIPTNDTIYLQNELDLKKSKTSHRSEESFISKEKIFGQDVFHNKTSMTTNHKSTGSFRSLGKSQVDDECNNRKSDMFTSNNSSCTTYSMKKNILSLAEYEQGKNAVSFVLGSAIHDAPSPIPLNTHPFQIVSNSIHHNSQKRKNMYTFGGLLTPLLQQNPDLVQSQTVMQQAPQNLCSFQQLQQRLSLANNVKTKSIEQLYNNLYLNSEKKSMILEETHCNVKLSPVQEENYSHAKQSMMLELSEIKSHQPHSDTKKGQNERPQFDFTSKIDEVKPLSYEQWKGIKGLLNESCLYEMKESIHCGPEIRAPLNIKLQLLDKFGREIAQSILPGTPKREINLQAQSVRSVHTEERSMDYY